MLQLYSCREKSATCLQNSVPIWLPHWPTWNVMISLTRRLSIHSSMSQNIFVWTYLGILNTVPVPQFLSADFTSAWDNYFIIRATLLKFFTELHLGRVHPTVFGEILRSE